MSTMSLTVSPESFLFNDKEMPDLLKTLADVDKHTIVTPVGTFTDLCLTEEGRTTNGYKYSTGALIQLCGLVAPGLSQMVMDLSGQWRKPGDDHRIFSSYLAVETMNKVIRLRFDRKLLGLQLVRNTRLKIIDGIVGSKYRYLANSDFLSRVAQECQDYRSSYHEACLYGRQFVVRYVSRREQPLYTLSGDSFDCGYHFANSEIGGKSVRAATLLVRCSTGDSALCPFAAGTGGRVVHSGRDFEKRLHSLMGHIINKLPLVTTIESGGKLLESKPLGLGGEDHEKRSRHLVQMLTRRKLTQNFAQRVLSSAASKGRENADGLVDSLPSEQRLVLASRTAYDLFTALIREARKLPIDQREIAEQVAYAILTGKIGL